MGYVIQPSSGEVPVVPDDLYLATIVSTKPVKLEEPDQFGKTDKIEIKVEFDVDDETVTLDPRVNQAWSEKATLFKIAIATGLEVSPLEGFDIAQLEGRQVRILTEQEEGKWPRIKEWSRVPQKKAGKTEAKTPAVVTSDGEPDYTAFWSAVNALGVTKKNVYDRAGGMEAFMNMDGADVAYLLEELKVAVEAG